MTNLTEVIKNMMQFEMLGLRSLELVENGDMAKLCFENFKKRYLK